MLEKELEKVDWPSAPVHVTDHDFEGVLSRYPLVLVDFWASWCMPCRMIAPILDQISGEYAGKAVITKLDVDQSRKTAEIYRVSSIPTLILFKNARPVERVAGALPREAVKGLIERHL
ncbi:MAG: thioredoxin [Candidatus Thermoplasmatota archaeon]|nr:thioredoxin [Candidatus Thermoplasmatota archaeon]